jgi:hypothetical protein
MNQLRCKNADARAKSGIRRAWTAEHPLQTDAAWNGPWRVHSRIQVRRHYSRDIEDWLIEKARIEATQQAATLRWAMIAGWAGIISAILTAAGIAIGFWMAK